MYNLKEIKKTCELFDKAYYSYNEYIFDWIEDKTTIIKTVNEIFSKSIGIDLPEDYWIDQAALYTDGQLLTDPKTIKKIRKETEGFMPSEARKSLAYWMRNPGFWCFYAITETLGDDFFTIEDLVTGDAHLMHSSPITFLQTKSAAKNKNYLSLMLPNGSCLQTIGFPKFFSLPASDLQFFFSLFSPGLDLGPAINKNFIQLIELETIGNMPPFFGESVGMKQIWQPFKLKNFNISDLEGTWDAKELGKQQIFKFAREAASYTKLPNSHIFKTECDFLKIELVRDNTSGEMGLFTSTDTSYTLFAALLNRSYPELALPEKPAVSISLGLSLLLEDGDYPLPWKKYTALLDAMDGYTSNTTATLTQKVKPEFEQGFMEMLTSDKSVDMQDVLSGMDASHEEIVAVYTVEPADKVFEMFDWPQPPKQLQDLFDSPLDDSVVFEVMDTSTSRDLFNTLTNQLYAEVIEEEGLASFITSLFDDKFPEKVSMPLMNAFIWILFHKGREWVPARSYAIEILKMQPYPLTDIYFEREAFLQDFTAFIKKVLCTRGICSLAKRPSSEEVRQGTYTIKATDAFYSLIRPGEYKIY